MSWTTCCLKLWGTLVLSGPMLPGDLQGDAQEAQDGHQNLPIKHSGINR
jgi:hypothetical protein